MIEISTTTQANPPAPVELPRVVPPVAPVDKGNASSFKNGDQQGNRSGDSRATNGSVKQGSLDANVIPLRDSSMQFRIDQDSDRIVVSLLDGDGEVVKQIPSELILRLAQRLDAILEQGKLGLDEMA